MGIASYDLNFDSYPEYFLTSMADNRLQTLAAIPAEGQPKPTFKEEAYQRGVTAQRPYTGGELKPSTAWHAQFEDVNNDGLVDLFIAKGNVTAMPDFAMKDPNNLLVQGADGKFVECGEGAGVASLATARGAALADFNLDGRIDLVVVNRGSPAQIWRNVTEGPGHWIEVRLRQPGAEPRRDRRLARNPPRRRRHAPRDHGGWRPCQRAHRLDPCRSRRHGEAELRVVWPDGTAGDWQTVPSDRFYVIERGKAPEPWSPG